MEFKFHNHYLAVGRRQVDWSIVWFKPYGDRSGKTGAYGEVTLYKSPVDRELDALENEPLFGEVLWFPFYDWKTMPAQERREKLLKQLEFLSDVYDYCNCSRRDALGKLQLEQKFTVSGDSRRNNWLAVLKGCEKGMFRSTRRRNTGADGTNNDDRTANDALDDSDSGVEVTLQETEHAARERMPPPPFRERNANNSANSRRKRSGNAHDDFRSKKSRPSASKASFPSGLRRGMSDTPDGGLFVNGARGSSMASHRSDVRNSPSILNGWSYKYYLSDGGEEGDGDDGQFSSAAPTPQPSSSNNHTLRPDGYAGSVEADGSRVGNGLGSAPGAPGRAGSRRAAAPLITPAATNGSARQDNGDEGSSPSGGVARRDQRAGSKGSPINLDDNNEVGLARPAQHTSTQDFTARMQNFRNKQNQDYEQTRHLYQDPSLSEEAAFEQARQASLAPEPKYEDQPDQIDRRINPAPEDTDEDAAIQHPIRESPAPEDRLQRGGDDDMPGDVIDSTEDGE